MTSQVSEGHPLEKGTVPTADVENAFRVSCMPIDSAQVVIEFPRWFCRS